MEADKRKQSDKKADFSVLMSLYFSEKAEYFELCIKSILGQTVKPTEIVIVKDGPVTDKVEKVLQQYIKKYPYKPKENRNINYEALIIELLKDEKDVLKIQEKYSIAERTYRRNVKKLETTNNRLYLIYKKSTNIFLKNKNL